MHASRRIFFAALVTTLTPLPLYAQAEPPADTSPSTPARPLQLTGAINDQSPRNSNGMPYEDRRQRFEQGRRYRVSVMASGFDPIVQILRPGETTPVAWDDDSGPGVNARTVFVPRASGEYIIRTLSFVPEGRGTYRLYTEEALPLPPPQSTEPPAGRAPDRTIWTTYSGALTPTDPTLDGPHFDDYLVRLRANEEMFVRLDATAFDPLVQVLLPSQRESEFLAADDDSAGNRNALLLFRAPYAGDYIVRVTAFSPTRTRGYLGAYRLRIGR